MADQKNSTFKFKAAALTSFSKYYLVAIKTDIISD